MSEARFVPRDFRVGDLPAIEEVWVSAWIAVGLGIDFDARQPWLRARLATLAGGASRSWSVSIRAGVSPAS